MNLISAMPRFSQPAPIRMGNNSGGNDENTIDYSKVDWKLRRDIEKGSLPISLFVKTTQAPTAEQLQEMKDLGMNVNPIAGSINTARLVKLDQFAKISRLPYITSMQGSTQMRPTNG